jgi:Xaa-Pro aminopeptidase
LGKNRTFQERVEKLRGLMREQAVEAILLRKRRSFAWITGGGSNHILNTTELGEADLLIFPGQVICLATKMEAARVKDEEMAGIDCEWVTPEWYEGTGSAVARLCRGKKIGWDAPPPSAWPVDGIDLASRIAQLAYVLDEEEIKRYRWLAQTAAKALEAACREIEPGMTEFEIEALLAANVIRHGIHPQVLLIATDERVFAYRHPLPTEKKLRKYAMLVICAERWGLVANATRCVHFGPLPEELAENRQKLAQIDLAMNLATRPGVPIREVFARGIGKYQELGYADDWRYLHQGGPTGYASREFLATADCDGAVQLHQAFAWNPAVRGIKSEDTILVGAEGNEFLSHTGEWPYIKLGHNGETYLRPDILLR